MGLLSDENKDEVKKNPEKDEVEVVFPPVSSTFFLIPDNAKKVLQKKIFNEQISIADCIQEFSNFSLGKKDVAAKELLILTVLRKLDIASELLENSLDLVPPCSNENQTLVGAYQRRIKSFHGSSVRINKFYGDCAEKESFLDSFKNIAEKLFDHFALFTNALNDADDMLDLLTNQRQPVEIKNYFSELKSLVDSVQSFLLSQSCPDTHKYFQPTAIHNFRK